MNPYDEDYFLRGKEKSVSLYENYSWKPELTIPMVNAIISHLGVEPTDSVLDFGCARGYVVKAFRELNYVAYGYDVSEWAVKNSDPMVREFLTTDQTIAFPGGEQVYDWIIAKDVLEHIPNVDIAINLMLLYARKGVFVVVPLSYIDGDRYVVGCYEKDVTHVWRWTLRTWAAMFMYTEWSVEARYRVKGVKDNYWRPKFEYGNGFITARRL